MKTPDIILYKFREKPVLKATCSTCGMGIGYSCHHPTPTDRKIHPPHRTFTLDRGEIVYAVDGYFHSPDNDTPAYIRKEEGLTIKQYFKHGKLHRENGLPAKEVDDCNEWYENGKLHRVGAPAIDYFEENTCGFYLRGRRYLKTKTYCKIAKLSAHDELMLTLKYGNTLPDFKW
jgi:hypothetical protein